MLFSVAAIAALLILLLLAGCLPLLRAALPLRIADGLTTRAVERDVCAFLKVGTDLRDRLLAQLLLDLWPNLLKRRQLLLSILLQLVVGLLDRLVGHAAAELALQPDLHHRILLRVLSGGIGERLHFRVLRKVLRARFLKDQLA